MQNICFVLVKKCGFGCMLNKLMGHSDKIKFIVQKYEYTISTEFPHPVFPAALRFSP